ncbi:hypothetical protein CJF30_00004809 [Rutstroemia sp. NJR-2017a BBW]|nr:hypothetical protein CJF30_00004809 [Rutstroemia sp. NJR-2017a BBW]
MPLTIHPCSPADFPRVFEIFSLAFGQAHVFVNCMYPSHYTPSGRAVGATRMAEIAASDPNTKFIKLVDDETGEMVAWAKWNIYVDTIPEEKDITGDYWENDEDKQFVQHLTTEFMRKRRAAVEGERGNLVSLDILCVDPAHQRRGAGRQLVKWGTKIADDLGFTVSILIPNLYFLLCLWNDGMNGRTNTAEQAVVESSDKGRGLYASEGFEFVEKCETPVPEKWKARGAESFNWMVRPKKAKVEA